MLRITVEEASNQVTLRLEGNLIGAWVTELEEAWRAASANLASRLLCLDLTAVGGIDPAGRYLLLLLHDRGARLMISGQVITEIDADIVEGWHLRKDP